MHFDEVATRLAQPAGTRSSFVPIEARAVMPALAAALDELHRRDKLLLERLAAERAICHRLAVYLESEMNRRHGVRTSNGWHVDCEYNLFGSDRRTNARIEDLKKRIDVMRPRDAGVSEHRVYPDLIVHRRDTTDNRLVLETKVLRGDSRWEEIEYDVRKLAVFADRDGGLGYENAGFLVFYLDGTTPKHQVFVSARSPIS